MKWVLSISSLDALDGGPSDAVCKLAMALTRAGDEVTLLSLVNDPAGLHASVQKAQDSGVRVRLIPSRRRTRFRYSRSFKQALVEEARNADIISSHGFYQYPSVAAYRAAEKRGVPLILQPHGVFEPYQEQFRRGVKKTFMAVVGRRLINRVNRFMVASEQEVRGLEQTLRVDPSDVGVVGLGVDVSDLPSEDPDRYAKQNLLFLSRIAEKKRLDKLLEAMSLVQQSVPGTHLTVCGDGDRSFVDAMQDIAVPDGSVSWLGHLSGAARREVEARQSLFVLPSDNENFGLAVVEAMAVGLPVLTTTETGAGAHVVASGAGWVIEPPTVEDLAEHIVRALGDPEDLRRKGVAGFEYAKSELSWDAVAGRWQTQAEQVLRSSVS